MFTHRSPAAPRGAVLALPHGSRRGQAQRKLYPAIAWYDGSASEPAQEVLRNTLRSACEVIGADRGFTLQTREEAVLEIACAHRIVRDELLEIVLGCAARALQQALVCGQLGLVDDSGLLPHEAEGKEHAPVVVALPLDLGGGQRGALCLLRSGSPRALSDLDLEILGALADQAALAVRAANQESALSRLAASLHAFAPQLI